MANKNKSQKNRRQRKNKTLRGGGIFDWLTGSSSTNTAPTAKSTSWFGNLFSSAPKQSSAVAAPAPLPASAVSEPTTAPQKPSEEIVHPAPTEPKLGGKRKNKSNKNKNRKNKH